MLRTYNRMPDRVQGAGEHRMLRTDRPGPAALDGVQQAYLVSLHGCAPKPIAVLKIK